MLGNKILLSLVVAGVGAGLVSAYVSGAKPESPPPVFSPAPNPFAAGVYANGIIESDQAHGQNTNLYPEVAGVVTEIATSEGDSVAKGDVLLAIDDSVQRATTEQLHAQAEAAQALLEELRAQPRRETLRVAQAEVAVAAADLQNAKDKLAKVERSHAIDARSVSRDALDSARNAVAVAGANHTVATRQYELTKAGAWIYDIQNQERQYDAANKAYLAARALLAKYRVQAPRDGVVFSVQAAVGSYVSPQGVFNAYTQSYDPIATMGDAGDLAVRCYVDEVLVPRLPDSSRLAAKMFIRGSDVAVPLSFVRVQPFVSPKIQLSNARTEKVDLRVLPVIFRFEPPAGTRVYPGQLVDIYLSERPTNVARPQDGVRGASR